MTVTVYRSTDSSAPTLSGTAGDLVNVLDKCLVAGYGSKAAAGWSKPFTGTNTAVFRMGSGVQHYLDVDDTGPGPGGAREARFRGYETMTAVATGTGPYPTVAQETGAINPRKSATLDATARAWRIVADDRTFWLLIQSGDSAGVWWLHGFGEVYSFVTGIDNFRSAVWGKRFESASAPAASSSATDMSAATGGPASFACGYAARTYTGLGGSVAQVFSGDVSKMGAIGSLTQNILAGTMALPNPVDGCVWLAPITVSSAGTVAVRGKLRGLMHYLHPASSFANEDTIAGAGVYAGHTFQLFKATPNAAAFCIDITSWDTN